MNNNVLVIAPTMFSADYGGATRIIEHMKALKSIGASVSLHTYAMQGNLDRALSITVEKLPILPRFYQGALLDRSYLDFLMALKVVLAQGFKPNFILSYNQEAGVISKVANKYRVPVVMDIQGVLGEEMFSSNTGTLGKAGFKFERKLCKFPALIIVSSPFIARFLHYQFDVRLDKLKVMLDTADTDLFMPRPKNHKKVSTMRSSLGICDDQRVILYVGSFSSLQGTDVLLKSAKHVLQREKNVLFLLAGGRWSSDYSSYVQLAHELGISSYVKFLPGVHYVNDLPYLLNLADVSVAPKQFSLQSHGKLAVLMASALPIVVWDNPINRVFLNSLGIYAKDNSAEAFGDAIISALNSDNSCLSSKLRERAVNHFSLKRLTADMLSISIMMASYS